MAHTPGPWKKVYRDGSTRIEDAAGNSLMCDEQYYPWCPDNEDDWNLIAAAPDLLEALEEAEKAEGALINEWADFWDVAPHPLIERLLKAQAARNSAIAKAEGK